MNVLELRSRAESAEAAATAAATADGGAPAEIIAFPATPDPRVRRRSRRLGYVLVGCGLALLPWLFVLALGLPSTTTAAHWSAAWVGLDTLEALALIGTGVLAIRHNRHRAVASGATAALLTVDAWFDVMTAAPGADFATALAMALLVELPLAALCAVLAVRASSIAGRA
ncbi:hypothetical protein AB0I22_39640 [Streptomyces sp. NPDC050610]|uniref:hypothetical protein n=1 Tax=Streptomyces sp. NPDC050610 TaxID=3157097 RepID=UPI00341AEA73